MMCACGNPAKLRSRGGRLSGAPRCAVCRAKARSAVQSEYHQTRRVDRVFTAARASIRRQRLPRAA